MRRADRERRLRALLEPRLRPDERAAGQFEGWILGVE